MSVSPLLKYSPRFGSLQLFRSPQDANGERCYTVVLANGPIKQDARVYLNGLVVGDSVTVKAMTRKYRDCPRSLQDHPDLTGDILDFLAQPHDIDRTHAEHRSYPFLDNLSAPAYFDQHIQHLNQLFRSAYEALKTQSTLPMGEGLQSLVNRVTHKGEKALQEENPKVFKIEQLEVNDKLEAVGLGVRVRES